MDFISIEAAAAAERGRRRDHRPRQIKRLGAGPARGDSRGAGASIALPAQPSLESSSTNGRSASENGSDRSSPTGAKRTAWP